MKRIAIIVLLMLPYFSFAQNAECIIKGSFEKALTGTAKIDLLNDANLEVNTVSTQNSFEFKNVLFADSIQIVWLRITYSEHSYREVDFIPVYCSGGIISIIINDPSTDKLKVVMSGPQESINYYEHLYLPVMNYNYLGDVAYNKFIEAQKAGSTDSIYYHEKARENSHLGFDVNRNFIKQNPNSLVSIQALIMMGTGDRTGGKIRAVADPIKELNDLFNSLSSNIQNSKEGKRYRLTLNQLKENTN